jgi:hypothetical protein
LEHVVVWGIAKPGVAKNQGNRISRLGGTS